MATPADPFVPRRALVTGGAKRIGRAICDRLAASGLDVAVHYNRSAEDARALAETLSDRHGVKAAAVGARLDDEDEIRSLVGRAEAALGPIDVLVNNASVFEADTAVTADRASWDRHMTVNLYAPLALTQEFVRRLADGRGVVVNVIDQRVVNATPHFTTYTLSKVGLHALTKTLAQALAPGVRVNAVAPGPTFPSTRQTDAQFEAQWRNVPLERPVDADEIAAGVRFILDAPSMTGQTIVLDGGEHLGWAAGPKAPPPE